MTERIEPEGRQAQLKEAATRIAGPNSMLVAAVTAVVGVQPREQRSNEGDKHYAAWAAGFSVAMSGVENVLAQVLGVRA
jgi:hypothetical protein